MQTYLQTKTFTESTGITIHLLLCAIFIGSSAFFPSPVPAADKSVTYGKQQSMVIERNTNADKTRMKKSVLGTVHDRDRTLKYMDKAKDKNGLSIRQVDDDNETLIGVGDQPADDPSGPSFGSSLRIMTYNTALIIGSEALKTHTNEGKFGMEDTHRAAKIAEGILKRTTADVIALNEVVGEDARAVLVNQLKNRYPHYIGKLDEDGDSTEQDSGLMLFSKWPFVDLSKNAYTEYHTDLAWEGTATANQVGFVLYEDYHDDACDGVDCFANKGAGLVRLRNPHTHAIVNVVFTHMQASYGDDDDDEAKDRVIARRYQMRAIEDLIRGSLTESELRNELLLVCGDLNINGNRYTWSPPSNYDPEWEWYFSAYHSYNHPSHGFFACGNKLCDPEPGKSWLMDSWHYTTSPGDIGQTQGGALEFLHRGEGERLDYILYASPQPHKGIFTYKKEMKICAQHMTLAYEVGEDDGLQQFSDHLPVHGDYNLWADHCCPQEAHEVAFHLHANQHVPGEITYPGSMQWYLINKSGTYSMRVNNPDVEFLVYEAEDLSHPVNPKQ